MSTRKDRFALISRFEKICKDRGTPVTINRYIELWAAEALFETMSKEDLHDAMDYYFKINREDNWQPSWQFYAKNVDKLLGAKKDADRDAVERAEIRRKLKEVMNEH